MNIQSISDIITNSSSEVFCRISSEDSLELIKEILKPLFPDEGYSEDSPSLYERFKSEDEIYYTKEYLDNLPEKWLEISLPYSMDDVSEFYKAGLEAILSNKVSNFEIIYGEY